MRYGESAELPPLTQFRPMIAKPLTLPGHHSRGPHEDQDLPPSGPVPRHPGPEDAVCGSNARSFDGSLVDPKLMAQGDMRIFFSNWLVGGIMTLALVGILVVIAIVTFTR